MAFPGENIPIAAEVTRAARELVGRSVERPVVLGYHPVARMNPFQELLYLTGPESGVGVVPLIKQADFPVLEAAVKMGVPAVLHLHWTSAIMAPALNEFDAERRARLFITELEDLKALGVRLVWTVHNVLPHHCKYASAEARMRGELAALADGIHIMNPATVEEVAEHYELPVEKTFQIPHPSYAEFYPRIARGDARFALGFEPDDVVIGAIGSIQPYKGLRTLGSAVAEASRSNRRVTGLVAGMPGPDSAHVIEDLARWPSVRTIAKKLSDRELAQAMTAIDFMALPYERTLNSGAAALAATFGVPIIAPRVGAFQPMLDAGMGIGFDPEQPAALVRAVESAGSGDFARDSAAEDSYRPSIDPTHVSERFFGEIIDRMSMHTGKASVEPSPTTHSSRPAELAALRGPKKGSVRVLTVGSIPPEWGGSVAGGVATVHRSLVEAFLKSNAVDLVGVIPTRRVDESLIPGVVPLVQDSTEEGFKELASSVDVILMNHITHRWADYQARTRETPCIGFVHSWSKYLRSSDPDAVRRHLKQNMIGMTCLVFPSRFCADEGESLGFEYPVGVRVIRNSVPQLYESEPPIRDRRGVVFIGALNDWKRPDLVIEACAQLQVPLSIVGDGPNRARLEYLAGDGDVQFKGELPPSEVRELLLASEALCVPSRSESFGLVYLEAAASGTPSVGHGPSISELFETVGVPCGVGVPPDATVEQVVTALREVLDHQWDHRMMHQGAIRALGPDRFAAQFVDLVTEVASSEESDGTGCR